MKNNNKYIYLIALMLTATNQLFCQELNATKNNNDSKVYWGSGTNKINGDSVPKDFAIRVMVQFGKEDFREDFDLWWFEGSNMTLIEKQIDSFETEQLMESKNLKLDLESSFYKNQMVVLLAPKKYIEHGDYEGVLQIDGMLYSTQTDIQNNNKFKNDNNFIVVASFPLKSAKFNWQFNLINKRPNSS
jgi:hypothetical protein